MTPKLTDDIRQAITEHGGAPLYLVDATTNARYVLLRVEQFEQMKALPVESEAETMYPLLADVDSDDWEDASNYGIHTS